MVGLLCARLWVMRRGKLLGVNVAAGKKDSNGTGEQK
jgi:hypothetical protein